MKRVVIGFARPRHFFFKPFSWIIRLIEWTPYSHVYIRSRADSLGVDLVYQASGVQVNFVGISHFKDQETSVYEFEVDVTDDKYRDFMRWAIVNAGAPYSLKQALGILLLKLFNLRKNPLSDGRKSWVCSELAGFFLVSFVGVSIKDDELDVIGPRGIFDICRRLFKEIEIGG